MNLKIVYLFVLLATFSNASEPNLGINDNFYDPPTTNFYDGLTTVRIVDGQNEASPSHKMVGNWSSLHEVELSLEFLNGDNLVSIVPAQHTDFTKITDEETEHIRPVEDEYVTFKEFVEHNFAMGFDRNGKRVNARHQTLTAVTGPVQTAGMDPFSHTILQLGALFCLMALVYSLTFYSIKVYQQLVPTKY